MEQHHCRAHYHRMDTSTDASSQTPPSTPKCKRAVGSTGLSPHLKRSKASCGPPTPSNDENAVSSVAQPSDLHDVKRMQQQTAGGLVFSGLGPNNFSNYFKSLDAERSQAFRNIERHNNSLPESATSVWTSLSAEQRAGIVEERNNWNELPDGVQTQIVRLHECKHSSKLRNFR